VRGPEHHVGHHVERALEVLVEEARVDRRRLLAGPRVDLRAHAVEDLVDLRRAEAVRALEEQVLEEVRDAGFLDLLVARSGADPEAERDGADRVDPLRYDPEARVELGDLRSLRRHYLRSRL